MSFINLHLTYVTFFPSNKIPNHGAFIVVDYSNSITAPHFKTIVYYVLISVLLCVTTVSNEELSPKASMLLNEAKKKKSQLPLLSSLR